MSDVSHEATTKNEQKILSRRGKENDVSHDATTNNEQKD